MILWIIYKKLCSISLNSTKVKTAFTREYNKAHPDKKAAKAIKKLSVNDIDLDEGEEDVDKVQPLEEDVQMLEI